MRRIGGGCGGGVLLRRGRVRMMGLGDEKGEKRGTGIHRVQRIGYVQGIDGEWEASRPTLKLMDSSASPYKASRLRGSRCRSRNHQAGVGLASLSLRASCSSCNERPGASQGLTPQPSETAARCSAAPANGSQTTFCCCSFLQELQYACITSEYVCLIARPEEAGYRHEDIYIVFV